MAIYIKNKFFTAVLALFLAAPFLAAQQQWGDAGRTITEVNTSLTHHNVTADGRGGFFLAWENNLTTDTDIFAQWIDASGTPRWGSSGITVTSAAGDQTYPALAADGSGGVFVAWQDELSWDIYLHHLDSDGAPLTPSGGIHICSAAGEQSEIRMIADGAGGAILVWYDKRHGSATDLYAQKINAANELQWAENGVAVTAAAGVQSSHTVVPDGSGGAVVVWQDARNGEDDIYAQRITAEGTAAWTADGIAVTAQSGNQMNPAVIRSEDNFIAAWTDGRSDGGDIYSQALDLQGSILWTAGGIAVCSAGGTQNYVSLTPDTEGGAVITWTDNRSWYDIYAQRISADGTVQWAADGIAVYADQNSQTQYKPKIMSDGSEGACIVWMDLRSGSSYDLYMQHLTPDGSRTYADTGIALSSASGLQDRNHILVSDSSGGSLVIWYDKGDADDKIMAQLLNNSIEITAPAADELLSGGTETLISWSRRVTPGAFDHLQLVFTNADGSGRQLIAGNLDPAAVSAVWTPEGINSTASLVRLEAMTSLDSVICSFESPLFSVDSEPPRAFGLLTPGPEALTSLTPEFSWETAEDSLSGPVVYQLLIDGAPVETGLSGTVYTLTSGQGLSEGTHSWYVEASDRAGLVRQSPVRVFTASSDHNPPAPFDPVTPAAGLWTADSILTFTWTASSDAESGLAGYRLIVDGSTLIDAIAPELTSVTAPALTAGPHTWRVEAFDFLGNTRPSDSRTFTIDNVKPAAFSISGPPTGTWLPRGSVTFLWEASADTGIGLAAYRLVLNGEILQDGISADSSQYTLSAGQKLAEGLHTWSVQAADSLGNTQTASGSFSLGVDTTAPSSFRLTAPAADSIIADASPTFSWEAAADHGSGLNRYQLWIDDSLNRDTITSTAAAVSGPLSEGSHTWQIRAIDNAGNSTVSQKASLVIDTSAPVPGALLTPAHGSTLHTDKPVFIWTRPADAVSGIKKVLFFINGQIAADNLTAADTSFTPDYSLENGSYHWKIKAYDYAGNVAESPANYFTVNCRRPRLTSPLSVTAVEDELFTYTAAWTDEDGDDITIIFSDIPSWLTADGLSLSGTPHNDTPDTLFSIIAVDPVFIDTFTVDIRIQYVNDPPVISAVPDQVFAEDTYSDVIPFTVSDEETPAGDLIVTASSGSPEIIHPDSLIFDGTGRDRTVQIIPMPDQFGTAVITLRVSDGEHQDSTVFTCTVTPVNDPPRLSAITDQSCLEDERISSLPFTVSDPETDAGQLRITVTPADTSVLSSQGISISGDGENRFLSLTPKPDAWGESLITICVSDGELETCGTFLLTVIPVNDAPVITSPDSLFVNEHDEVVYTAAASDIDSEHLSFRYTDYPEWLTPSGIDIGGRVPKGASSCSFTLVVDDGELNDSLTVAVIVKQVNDPPRFTSKFPEGVLRDIDSLHYTLILDDYIHDPDDHDSTLTWTWQVLNDIPVTVQVTGNPRTACIESPHFLGILQIIFTATDPRGASASDTLRIHSVTTDVPEDITELPRTYELRQNYPNPFNPQTTIRFSLPRSGRATLTVYNTRGQKIAVLTDRQLQAGNHESVWDASDCASGIYIYHLQAGSWQKSGRMLLLK